MIMISLSNQGVLTEIEYAVIQTLLFKYFGDVLCLKLNTHCARHVVLAAV